MNQFLLILKTLYQPEEFDLSRHKVGDLGADMLEFDVLTSAVKGSLVVGPDS